ncbi:MAG TPA: EthD family reductase [Hyphomicrobiaceae bacterium]|nr:EthD family reductase [Hyphomicrobiaceae bacterium]
MAAHLLVLYPRPKNAEEFDRAYREEHLPYAGPRLEGATSVVTKRVVGPSYALPPYHLISDVTFPTIESLKACAMSSRGKEALAHATSISSGGAPTMVVVVDEA